MTFFALSETVKETAGDAAWFTIKCTLTAFEKTANAVGAFVQNHPAIAEMTVNQAIQASFATCIALSGLAQATGLYEAIYGPDNRFHQCGLATIYTISVGGLVYLRSGRAPAVFDRLTVGDVCQIP